MLECIHFRFHRTQWSRVCPKGHEGMFTGQYVDITLRERRHTCETLSSGRHCEGVTLRGEEGTKVTAQPENPAHKHRMNACGTCERKRREDSRDAVMYTEQQGVLT